MNQTNLIAAYVDAHFFFSGWEEGGGTVVEEIKLVSSAETLISL